MATKINCDAPNCEKNTAYDVGSDKDKMERSFVPGDANAKGEVVFCATCWTALGYKEIFNRG